MLLIVGPNGGLAWDNTQTVVRHNWEFCRGRIGRDAENTPLKMFDSPFNWETFRCAGRCGGRILPIDIADVDHVQPKSTFTWNIVQQNADGTVPAFTSQANGNHWVIAGFGAVPVRIVSTGESEFVMYQVQPDLRNLRARIKGRDVTWTISDVLANNLDNLQLLCPPCNRSKGNR